MKNQPPKYAERLLRIFLPNSEREFLLGDYAFLYEDTKNKKGKFIADLWYWNHVFKTVPAFIFNSFYWGGVMLLNYLKVAFRNIKKQKTYSFINIAGLSMGMASCIIISLWIMNQLSYDKFHKDADNIYMVLMQGKTPDYPATPWPLAEALKDDFPEIEKSTRFNLFGETLIRYNEKVFNENNIAVVDQDFFEIFSFPFIYGNPANTFKDIYTTVITKTTAEKYFGNINPLGKSLLFNGQNNLVVAGVIEDISQTSSLQFDILIPVDFMSATNRTGFEMSWGWWSPNTFVKLNSQNSQEEMNTKIRDFLTVKKIEDDPPGISIIPFTETFLFFSGAKDSIFLFAAIAIFLIGIACINFINLSTARSSTRAKEIGIRQVNGAFRKNLILQFLSESLLISFISLLAALIIVKISLPYFNSWFETRLMFDLNTGNQILIISLILMFLTGIIAGSYPALVLSSFRPVKILRGEFRSGKKGILLRKILVTVQFTLSIFLIVSTGAVKDQLEYFIERDIGYDKENLLVISLKGDSRNNYHNFKNELLTGSGILGVSGSASGLPFFTWSSGTCDWEGKDPNQDVNTMNNFIDYDFFETFNIDLKLGRKFLREFPTDTGWVFIINEEMQRIMETDNALGKRLTYWGNDGTIIGVTKNFFVRSFYNKLDPLVLMLRPNEMNTAYIRIAPGIRTETINWIEKIWERTNPGYPFEFRFMDEQIETRYRSLNQLGNLINIFAFMAIFTACLGLFGLASFVGEQRTKEISIRKVHGATVIDVLLLFIWKFLPEIIVANLIALPVAYLAVDRWLNKIAYRVPIEAELFIISTIITMIIVLISISYQTIKAANSKPVEALKYE
ncbi:ABC transporter permease [Bacteroidota bacterium]